MKFDRPWTLNRHIPRCPGSKQAHVLIFSASLVYHFSCPIPIILGWQVIERVSSQWMGDIELSITSNSTFIVYLTTDGTKLDVAVTDFDWLEEYLEAPPTRNMALGMIRHRIMRLSCFTRLVGRP